jgi:hypothetical protein
VHQEADIMYLTARTVILTDAAATTATALLMVAARGVLYPYFGLTSPLLLDVTAVAFIVYAAIITLVARQPMISRGALMTIAAANIAYVVASLVLLVMFWGHPSVVGRALIFAVALAVEAFALLQLAAARRMTTAGRAATVTS